jgi:hypothetical protein
MKLKTIVALAICAGFAFSGSAHAQDLGPQFSKSPIICGGTDDL